jgi:hypothetical protein
MPHDKLDVLISVLKWTIYGLVALAFISFLFVIP